MEAKYELIYRPGGQRWVGFGYTMGWVWLQDGWVWLQDGLGLVTKWVGVWLQDGLGLVTGWVGFGYKMGWVRLQDGLGFVTRLIPLDMT